MSPLGALTAELKGRGKSSEGIAIVIADRTFEAWILAGAVQLHEDGIFKVAPKFGSFEGKLGKEQKKGLVELDELLGRPYSKTKDGPALFARLSLQHARHHLRGNPGSKSLDKFLRTLVPLSPRKVPR